MSNAISQLVPEKIDDAQLEQWFNDQNDTTLVGALVAYLNATDKARKKYISHRHTKSTTTAYKSAKMWGKVNENIPLGVGARFVRCVSSSGVLTSAARQSAIDCEMRCDNPTYPDRCGVYETGDNLPLYFLYFPRHAHKVRAEWSNKDTARMMCASKVVSNPDGRERVISLLARLVCDERAGHAYSPSHQSPSSAM